MNNKLGIIITFSYTTNQQQQTKQKKRMIPKNGNFHIFTKKIITFKNITKNVHLIV